MCFTLEQMLLFGVYKHVGLTPVFPHPFYCLSCLLFAGFKRPIIICFYLSWIPRALTISLVDPLGILGMARMTANNSVTIIVVSCALWIFHRQSVGQRVLQDLELFGATGEQMFSSRKN